MYFSVQSLWAILPALSTAMWVADTAWAPRTSLSATLLQLNATHVEVSVTNPNPNDVSVLSWNSHFNPGTEHGSFEIHEISNGLQQALRPGRGRGTPLYTKLATGHFVNIGAGEIHQCVVDLTRLFHVPRSGKYNVTLRLDTRAVAMTEGISLPRVIDDIRVPRDLPPVRIETPPQVMHLAASDIIPQMDASQHRKRRVDKACRRRTDLTAAFREAYDLALGARNNDNSALWRQ